MGYAIMTIWVAPYDAFWRWLVLCCCSIQRVGFVQQVCLLDTWRSYTTIEPIIQNTLALLLFLVKGAAVISIA